MLYHATYPKTIIFNNMKNQKICQNKTFFFGWCQQKSEYHTRFKCVSLQVFMLYRKK